MSYGAMRARNSKCTSAELVDIVDPPALIGFQDLDRQAIRQPVIEQVEVLRQREMHLHVAVFGLPVHPGPTGVDMDAREGDAVLRPDEGVDRTVHMLLRHLEGPE